MGSYCRVYPCLDSVRNPLSGLREKSELSVGILDNSSEERLRTVLDWYTAHMDYDLHVMTTQGRFDIPTFMERYPSVSFILFSGSAFSGEMINQFAYRCHSPLFLIVRSDSVLIYFDGKKLASLMVGENHPAMVVPLRLNGKGEFTPDARIPLLTGDGDIAVECEMPVLQEGSHEPTLYPVMERGVYDTALFQRLRGYDEQIHSEYWQALDWGVRCWMMGYPIYLSPLSVEFFPGSLSLVEDQSRREGWKRCPTKALGVRKVGEKVEMVKPRRNFDRQAWDETLKLRFPYLVKKDFASLVKSWGA